MSSSSILSSKYYNKLNVNKLVANAAIINDLSVLNKPNPSYLYSLLFNTATLNKTTSGGTLTFIKSEVDSVIEFTDRPFRKTYNNFSIDDFIGLFYVVGNNTFSDDPPNGVLVTESGQKTYELLTASSNANNYIIELKLIDNEIHSNLNEEKGKMSFFVDTLTLDQIIQSYINDISRRNLGLYEVGVKIYQINKTAGTLIINVAINERYSFTTNQNEPWLESVKNLILYYLPGPSR
jgi:hypothetical protein